VCRFPESRFELSSILFPCFRSGLGGRFSKGAINTSKAVNTAPFVRILVLSMSFFLSLDMQSDKNNNDTAVRVSSREECASGAWLTSGSGLRGPEAKLWVVGDITTPTYPRRPVTIVSSSSSVSVPSHAHLG